MKTLYQDVCEFHEKFGLPSPDTVTSGLISREAFDFRVKFMKEELDEYIEAYVNRDPVKAIDALVDLVYVTLGTAAFHGFPFDQVWEVVHRANMKKVRTPSKDLSKRGSAFDVIKPPGWVGPEEEIRIILFTNWKENS